MATPNNIGNLPAVPEPRKFQCDPCKIYYYMGKETWLYLYRNQPWFNHIVSTCPKCSRTYTVWNEKPEHINYMMVHNTKKADDKLNVVHADYCDDERVKRAFAIDNHKPFLPDLWQSPRAKKQEDKLGGYFAELLNHVPQEDWFK